MDYFEILNKIESPSDIKYLSTERLNKLSEEIRMFLVNKISKTGGHLASNLGSIELTLGMHYVFDSPKDKLLFDVGHQCYTHKILTGRRTQFDNLRQEGGISGFPDPKESTHDAIIGGHSSTAISAGLGMQKAMELLGKDGYTVVLIGDGAFTGGMVYEAINNAGRDAKKLIVILNHNNMSISRNVGAFARYLVHIRNKPGYLKFKRRLEILLERTPLIGKKLKGTVKTSKTTVKNLLYHSNFFEDLGFHYIGPVDGHKVGDVIASLKTAKKLDKPVLIHAETIKGKGYIPAEKKPMDYHGVPKFNLTKGDPDISSADSYSIFFGQLVKELATRNDRICGVTAAMEYGTGLQYLHEEYPDRFFDVGIAEQHAMTFCVGMAIIGMIPIYAVYSTFLQRAYDQVIHDAAIQNQKVILAIDRAGVVGDDGETNQGIFDVSYLSAIPNVTIMSPASYKELEACLRDGIENKTGVVAVRYPRGKDETTYINESNIFELEYQYIDNGCDTIMVTYGRIFQNCVDALEILDNRGVEVSLLRLITIKPIKEEVVQILKSYKDIFFFEEVIESGGIGQQLLYRLHESGYRGNYKITAIKDTFIKHGEVKSILKKLRLDKDSISNTVYEGILNRSVYEK